jgi:Asp-tRNA(Asn)/Glu-tRNA(Gln) amidotransferase B subunit
VPADLGDDVLAERVSAIMEANQTQFAENPKLIMQTVMKELAGQAEPQRIIAEIKKHTQ